MQTALGTEGGMLEKGREWETSLYWFYTHVHATVDQSVGIAPDTWHVANKADNHGRIRERVRESRRRRAGRSGREWTVECSEWQTTGWWEEAGVMECEVEDLGRQRERPSACQNGTASHLSLFLSIFHCRIESFNQTHIHTEVQTHHSGQEK